MDWAREQKLKREQEQDCDGNLPLNQIQLKRYAELSGYTEKALRDKISIGVWVEGLHYYRAPDRHILINVKEVEKWQRNECQPA